MIGETVKCSFCDFESSATTVLYHESNRHPELLEREPYEPAAPSPCRREWVN